MKLFYPRFLESCCSNKDAAFSPAKLKSGDIDFHSLRHQYNLPFAGFNHAVNAADDDLFPVRWSKDDMWHSVSYPRSAGASPRSKIDSADTEMPWSSSYSVLESMESLAVVKRSENSRADFRRSMGEMVVQKGIYKVAELEQLLSLLSLSKFSSSSSYHCQSVCCMWEELFPFTPDGRRNTGTTGCQDP